jgi:hypothetical protein
MLKHRLRRYRLHYFPESGHSYILALMLTLCGESLGAKHKFRL